MKILYFDCFSGISGDMVIGALIDAGGDPAHLEEELKKLHMDDEYKLEWYKVVKNGITSTKFNVLLTNEEQQHHTHAHDHHTHDHHSHDHTHSHHHHGHDHRSYQDIVRLIESSDLSDVVKKNALNIFKKIGEAEGKIHGVPLDDVHFHEVGAVDSIIDIIGAAILIDQLEIEMIKSSPIPVGGGKIHIDHGVYPVPAPATLDILKGVPIAESELKAELTTPTGAAIAAVLAEEFSSLPAMKVTAVGYGAGTKTFKDHPNVLRVIIGE
ncbi:TIGR00299 family protein [Virgibacillus profundi]|uniref:TIGR00299 family protein n=1 Tax=Virgibacillus profundi TaxID=2024555 RepID=A0A2A2IFQ7_9BACI|nr:nickel pincer cofactor biosynthesis protein LarC [Virgibacillus profundi]PAV30609.1 TIGR00299 family protein [Virgibacillus profundi]PXY54781.1 nickel pincer cofactor biosynthesis protein LarC [Virgibacillus profundi]